MTPLGLTGLIFGTMLVLIAVRVPIAVTMFVAGVVGYVLDRLMSVVGSRFKTA